MNLPISVWIGYSLPIMLPGDINTALLAEAQRARTEYERSRAMLLKLICEMPSGPTGPDDGREIINAAHEVNSALDAWDGAWLELRNFALKSSFPAQLQSLSRAARHGS